MKRNNKKGFTIVELVIVIAVIGILAAIMIPGFSSIIESANKSEAIQVGRAYYMEYYAADLADGVVDGTPALTPAVSGCTYNADGTFTYNNGTYTATFDGENWTAAKN